jgi:hypothetical protein
MSWSGHSSRPSSTRPRTGWNSQVARSWLDCANRRWTTAQETGLLLGNAAQTVGAQHAGAPPEPVLASVRRHLSDVAGHAANRVRWSSRERSDYVRLVLRPYVAGESLVRELAEAGRAKPDAAPGAV